MESTAGSRLPKLLSRFHRAHRDIIVELQTGTSAALIRKIDGYELDAAFVGEPLSSAPGLQSRTAFDEELVLVTSRSHPAVRRPADLANGTILAFSQGRSYRKRLEEWFASDRVKADGVLELASYQAIIACAAAGTGCAIVPISVLHALRAAQDVKQHPCQRSFGLTARTWSGMGRRRRCYSGGLDVL